MSVTPRTYKTAVAATPVTVPAEKKVVGVLVLTAAAVTLTTIEGDTITLTPAVGQFIPGQFTTSSTTGVAFALAFRAAGH